MSEQPAWSEIAGLREAAPALRLLLCDVWGVVHNGVAHFAEACEALVRFRQGGGLVLLVSNAPRPRGSVRTQLAALKVPDDAWDDIVTSGDVAREMIAARNGAPLFHIGPERDLALFEGLKAPLAPVEQADYVVCTGLVDDERETAEDYAETLGRAVARGLPMICANPDLVVERGNRQIPCAGALGLAYETLGGAVTYPGKPYPEIYRAALRRASELAGGEIAAPAVLAVGDAIRTDIAGARRAGLRSLLVLDGIHAREIAGLNPVERQAWLVRQTDWPDLVIDRLEW